MCENRPGRISSGPRTKWMEMMTLSRPSLRLKRRRRNGEKAGLLSIGRGVRFQRGCLNNAPATTHFLMRPASPVRWCRVDKNKFLVGDIVGRLAMIVYTPPSGLTLLPLGEVSSPSVTSRFRLITHTRLLPRRLSPTLPLKWSMWDLTWQIRY